MLQMRKWTTQADSNYYPQFYQQTQEIIQKKRSGQFKNGHLAILWGREKKETNKVIGWPARITHLYFKIKKIIYLIENTNLTSIAFIICS